MNNPEELLYSLEKFSKSDNKVITKELDDYLEYVSQTGDPIYQWSQIKCLFREKFINVLNDFCQTSPGLDIPSYPNVDLFNFEAMKNNLLARLNSFISAPFTLQRICELLVYPQKQYSRIDKYMRAMEKNVLVVSSRDPYHHFDVENGDVTVNSSNSDNDVDMEDDGWKVNATKSQFEEQEEKSEINEESDGNEIDTKQESEENEPEPKNQENEPEPKNQENDIVNKDIDSNAMISCSDDENVSVPIYEDTNLVPTTNIPDTENKIADCQKNTSLNETERNISEETIDSDTVMSIQESSSEIENEIPVSSADLVTEQISINTKEDDTDTTDIKEEISDCKEDLNISEQSDNTHIRENSPKIETDIVPKNENIVDDNIQIPDPNDSEVNQDQGTGPTKLEEKENKEEPKQEIALSPDVNIDSEKKDSGDINQEMKPEIDCDEKLPEEVVEEMTL